MIIVFVIMAFLSGSLMFSYWLGIIVNKDIRDVGDGNPGAFNLWLAAGYKLGILGVFLDFMKGYLPLALLLERSLISEMELVPIGLASILGHAFSPFMRLKGGIGIAVSFGVWSAATKFKVSFAYAVILAIILVIIKILDKEAPIFTESDGVIGGIMAVLGMYILGIYMFFKDFPNNLLALWLGNSIILTYKNKRKLHTFIKSFSGSTDEQNNTIIKV